MVQLYDSWASCVNAVRVAVTYDIGGMLVRGHLSPPERSCGGGLVRGIRLIVASCETVALGPQWVETAETPMQTQRETAGIESRVPGLNLKPVPR